MTGMWLVWLAIIVLTSLPAQATVPSLAPWGRIADLTTGRDVAAPPGWLNYCLAEKDRCAPAAEASEVDATPELLALVQQVQADVNRRVAPRPEPAGRDLWQIADGSGDCEDFALAKQAALRSAGLPAGAVRLATARLPNRELHAVVTVATDDGTLVLDNLRPSAVPLRTLDYTWLRLQGVRGSLRWEELRGGGRSEAATAALPAERVARPELVH
jgi:predicted transglutaminase-like cysteine proteinase